MPSTPAGAVLGTYKNTLLALPGVNGVTVQKDGLHIATRSESASRLLDGMLEDTIDGVAVHFDAAPAAPKPPQAAKPKPTGPKKPTPPKPPLSPAEKAVRRYGKALAHVDHVTGVRAQDDHVVLSVDQKSSIPFVDTLVEDSINGVLVQFEAAA
jgi:hypothetical protein